MDVKTTSAIRSFIASYDVCPVAIPELFAQTQGSDYWKLIHYLSALADQVQRSGGSRSTPPPHLLTSCLKRKFFQRQDLLLQLNLKYPKFTYPFKLIVRADVKRNLSIPKHNLDHPLAFPIKRAWVRHLFDYLLFSVEIKKGANTVIILVFALLCVTNTTWFQSFSCETSQPCTDPKRGRGDRGKRDERTGF